MSMLEDRVTLVTGAAQGIGRAIAMELARVGSDIVVADINVEQAEETAEEIRSLGRTAYATKLDVSDFNNAQEVVKSAVERFGKLDHLVNNAGITKDNLIMRMKPEEWSAVISVNLTGVFNCTQAVVRRMMKQRYGRIVNIASVVGQMGNAGQVNYGSSKAGVIGLTKSTARELGSRNITVNAVAPGFIETAMTADLSEEMRKRLLEIVPLGTLGQPEDIAHAVKFLISSEASYITGAVINVNGGMYM